MDKTKSGAFMAVIIQTGKSRREQKIMLFMITVITVLGIACVLTGISMTEDSGYRAIGAELRISEREKCYKPAELRSIGTLRKFSVSDRFIQGVLRQGICSIDKHGRKDELNGFNNMRKYVLRYAEN